MTHLLSVVGPGDPAAHKTSLLTVASFRTWRGSQDSVAQGPAPSRVRKSKSSTGVTSGSTDRRQRRDDFPTGSSWPASQSFPRRQTRKVSLRPPRTIVRARKGGRLTRSSVWRRGWDSNPRCRCQHTCSPGTPNRPLSHLSAAKCRRGIILAWAPSTGKPRVHLGHTSAMPHVRWPAFHALAC